MATPYFKNYDPGRIIVVFNGVQLTGFADDLVEITRNTDAFSDEAGPQGDTVRIRSRDRRGNVNVTLQQASPSNDILSTFASTDESAGTAYGPVMVKDLNGTTLAEGANAWIVKIPDSKFAAAHGTRVWSIRVAELKLLVGGSLV